MLRLAHWRWDSDFFVERLSAIDLEHQKNKNQNKQKQKKQSRLNKGSCFFHFASK